MDPRVSIGGGLDTETFTDFAGFDAHESCIAYTQAMSRSAQSPRDAAPKRPTIRLRQASIPPATTLNPEPPSSTTAETATAVPAVPKTMASPSPAFSSPQTEKTPSLPPLPKMPTLPPTSRANAANAKVGPLGRSPTLPPFAPPPRVPPPSRVPPPPRRPSEAPKATTNANDHSDSWLDETEIRHAESEAQPEDAPTQSLPQLENVDFDSSLPGITEVKSALTFNRRQRTSTEDFDVTTARIDRKELLRQAAHLPVGEDRPTAPTLAPPTAPFPNPARATMQVSPDQIERVRRLSEKLENSDAAGPAVLELVDSVELSQDDLTDDLDASASLAASGPELQAFRNEDWGRDSYGTESESGERLMRDQPRPAAIVRFAEEEEPREPLAFSDVSFADDLSLVPDLTGETNALVPPTMLAGGYPSIEGNTALLAAPGVPHSASAPVSPASMGPGGTAALPRMGQAQMAYAQGHAPHMQTKPSPQMPMMHPEPAMLPQPMQQPMISVPTASGGFAPLNPGTKLRQSAIATQSLPAQPGHGGQAAFIPAMTAPRAFPIVNTALPASDAVMGASTGFGFQRAQESGHVSTSADVPSQLRKKERSGWAAPLLFVAVLVGSLAGVFLYMQKSGTTPPAAASSAANAGTASAPTTPSAHPTASAFAMATAAPVQNAPIQPVVNQPAGMQSAGMPPLVAASALPTAKAPATPAPKGAPPKAAAPTPPAPKKGAPAKGGPTPNANGGGAPEEGPKQLSPAAPAEAPAPAPMQGLGDLLNGAL